MNIAHLLPYTAEFPLKKHNGRYDWALRLAKIQASQGHDVTIYSAPQSTGDGIVWRSIPQNLGDKTHNNTALITEAFQHQEHDIFHSHFDYLHYLVADLTIKPIVFTQHWFPSQIVADAGYANLSGNVVAIPVTNFMKIEDQRLGIKIADRIYHGIDLSLFKPSQDGHSDRLLFVGRITPNKGVREAIHIAKLAGEKLDIVGKINNVDSKYWNDLLPLVDGDQIRYLGPKSQAEVAEMLSHAKAFLFPSQAMEAFGQVTIEAQACDTPVIISNLGASNELVQNDITGFVVSTIAEFVEALDRLDTIQPNACRKFAEQFDLQIMVNKYTSLYESLIS